MWFVGDGRWSDMNGMQGISQTLGGVREDRERVWGGERGRDIGRETTKIADRTKVVDKRMEVSR